jgi:OOP family OmpA-OmpF porin
MDKNFSALIILLSIFHVSNLQGQNLVKNYSFEEFLECPSRFNQFNLCKDWFVTGNGSTPEYFHGCSTYNSNIGYSVSVPENLAGNQKPRTGNAYAGIVLFASNKKTYKHSDDFYYREYIQGTLKEDLQKNKEYSFSFYINLAENSVVFSDRISICFSDKQLQSKAPYSTLVCQNKVTVKGVDFRNHETWIEVNGSYVADGGEKLITIGLFLDDLSKREFEKLNKENKLNEGDRHCYYYIDDVSVVDISKKIEFSHQRN